MSLQRWASSMLVLTLAYLVVLVPGRVAAEEIHSSLSLAPTPADFALGQDSGGSEESARTAAATTETSPRHPRWVTDLESKTWPGFLTGLSGYDDFVMPVGMPFYFEDPFITTDVRLVYIYHTIPNRSVLRGGQVHVVAAHAGGDGLGRKPANW